MLQRLVLGHLSSLVVSIVGVAVDSTWIQLAAYSCLVFRLRANESRNQYILDLLTCNPPPPLGIFHAELQARDCKKLVLSYLTVPNGSTFDGNHCPVGVGLVCRSVGRLRIGYDLSSSLSHLALSFLLGGMKDWMEESGAHSSTVSLPGIFGHLSLCPRTPGIPSKLCNPNFSSN